MKHGCGTNSGCANFCENGLLCYLSGVNAPLGTSRSFLPLFYARSVKTHGNNPLWGLSFLIEGKTK